MWSISALLHTVQPFSTWWGSADVMSRLCTSVHLTEVMRVHVCLSQGNPLRCLADNVNFLARLRCWACFQGSTNATTNLKQLKLNYLLSDLANSDTALRDTLHSAVVTMCFPACDVLRADVVRLPLWNYECSPTAQQIVCQEIRPKPSYSLSAHWLSMTHTFTARFGSSSI